MKNVATWALGLFLVGCGSAPALPAPAAPKGASADAARQSPRASRSPSASAGLPPVQGVAVSTNQSVAPEQLVHAQTRQRATPAQECLHILVHIAAARDELSAVAQQGDAARTDDAALHYVTKLSKLDREHPSLHVDLQIKVAALSMNAAQTAKSILNDGPDSVSDADALNHSLDHVDNYCARFKAEMTSEVM